jgi:Ca-activated chloride channel family protein
MRPRLLTLLLIANLTACSTSQPNRTASSGNIREIYPVVDGIAATERPAPARQLTTSAKMYALGIGKDNLNNFRIASEPTNRENYATVVQNAIKNTAEEPVSTFSIDVDTGSYSNVRRILNSGRLPPKDAVRVEELINYFDYDYPIPKSTRQPFSVSTEIAPTPWNQKTKLLHIGIKGYEVPHDKLPPANLVFLIDVSGSMNSPDKLELIKSSLKLLSQQMSERDKISIVVYAGDSGVLLEPTSANNTAKITAAIDSLRAGGSTNGGAGITLAYNMAQDGFIKDGINRVILATDGDFNVGTVSFESLLSLVEEKRKTGISLTTLGVGTGNYNDKLMERLADAGNGNHAYLDSLNEAQKVLVDEMSSTLHTIAHDVKIQIEFNPEQVSEYRLIGYENRALKREDFSNDKVDAGEIGAGHSVTALYEIALKGQGGERLENLRYADKKAKSSGNSNELAFLRLRYKTTANENSQLLETPLLKSHISQNLEKTSDNFRFSAAVAGFGQLLRAGQYTENFSYDDVKQLAQGARGEDKFGYRAGFINLVDLAKGFSSSKPTP